MASSIIPPPIASSSSVQIGIAVALLLVLAAAACGMVMGTKCGAAAFNGTLPFACMAAATMPTTTVWLGFSFDATLGYPGEGPPTELLTEATELWLSEVEKAKRLVEDLPFVKGEVQFHCSEGSANSNKVLATVWCCWEPSRRSFKQVAVACDNKDMPTHLQALHALRADLVRKHGALDHVHDERRHPPGRIHVDASAPRA